MHEALLDAREDQSIGVIFLTGAGPAKDGKYAFCAGGDQSVRGHGGYIDGKGVPRLNVLEVQKLIRSMPKVVIALVAGYAIGGGHVLHVMCDLTIAAENAIFGQVGPKMGSFDGGFGSSYLARMVGQKKAREIWFLCRQYNAAEEPDLARLLLADHPRQITRAEAAVEAAHLGPHLAENRVFRRDGKVAHDMEHV